MACSFLIFHQKQSDTTIFLFFLSCKSMYFPFSYSFLFSCRFQEMALSNDIYVCHVSGRSGEAVCGAGGGQLTPGSPLPCPEWDGAWVSWAPGTPVHLCLDSWVPCNSKELELSSRWVAPRLLRASVNKDRDFEAVDIKGSKGFASTHGA